MYKLYYGYFLEWEELICWILKSRITTVETNKEQSAPTYCRATARSNQIHYLTLQLWAIVPIRNTQLCISTINGFGMERTDIVERRTLQFIYAIKETTHDSVKDYQEWSFRDNKFCNSGTVGTKLVAIIPVIPMVPIICLPLSQPACLVLRDFIIWMTCFIHELSKWFIYLYFYFFLNFF